MLCKNCGHQFMSHVTLFEESIRPTPCRHDGCKCKGFDSINSPTKRRSNKNIDTDKRYSGRSGKTK